jgi:hypothetical protein
LAASVVVMLGAAILAGCPNAGDDRVLGIEATGLVGGFVYWDLDGNREPGGGDEPVDGVLVTLLVSEVGGVIAGAVSDPVGLFRMRDVPVGRYHVRVDTSSFGDTAQVVRIDTSVVALEPDDTATVAVAVSYPIVTVAEARALAIGESVFVEAVALNGSRDFGDSTAHLADTSAAIRVTRIRTPVVFAGDTIRLRGTVASRDGQPVLDDATPFLLALTSVPPAVDVTTAEAASARGGTLDAALVRVTDGTVQDTGTVEGDFWATVDDGSGLLELLFDQDVGFNLTPVVPDTVLTAVGVLVPAGTGLWQLKPRTTEDVTVN